MPKGPQRTYVVSGMMPEGIKRVRGVTSVERSSPPYSMFPEIQESMGNTEVITGRLHGGGRVRDLNTRLKQSAEPSKSTTVDKSGRYSAITADRKIAGSMGEVIGEAGRPTGKYRRGGDPAPPPSRPAGHKRSSINREGLMGLTAIPGSTTRANLVGIQGVVHAGPAGSVRKGTPGDSRSKHSSLHQDVGRASTSVRTAPLTRTVGYVTGPAGPYRRGSR